MLKGNWHGAWRYSHMKRLTMRLMSTLDRCKIMINKGIHQGGYDGDKADFQISASLEQINFRSNHLDDVRAKFHQLFWSSWNKTALYFSFEIDHCFAGSMYFHLYQKAQQILEEDHSLRTLNLYDWMEIVFHLSNVLLQ